ncbi:MAG: helix-turn-helix domain-containing protein [Roseburia sp.]
MEIKAANAEETIRCILDEEKMTQQDLADRMGITRQNISQSLNRNAKSMRYDSFSKMVTALGYEIVVKNFNKIRKLEVNLLTNTQLRSIIYT